MLKKSLLSLTVAVLLAAAMVYGVTRLFVLRYEKGDVYPPYSTLRTDPLGAKGLYDALSELPGLRVRRNFRPLPKLRPKTPVTLFYAGVPHTAGWGEKELREFQSTIHGGSRAVFTFPPVERPHFAEEERVAKREREKKEAADRVKKAEEKKDAKDKKKADKEEENDQLPFKEVAAKWGFAFGFLPPAEDKAYRRQATVSEPASGLDRELSWHTALYFKDLAPEWQVLYTSDQQPVVIERKFGNGTILLAADSFFLSNEALRTERHSQLLARLLSGPREIVFDEEHHGVTEDPGIVALARKYRLHGLGAGLLLLVALFVWKNSVRFLPAYTEEGEEGEVISGKEGSEGFVNLLRRTIQPSEVLGVCVEEWRRNSALKPGEIAVAHEVWQQEQTRPPRQRDPVAAYRAIRAKLTRKT